MNCSIQKKSLHFVYGLIIIISCCHSAATAGNPNKFVNHIGDGASNSFDKPAILLGSAVGIVGASYLDSFVQSRCQGKLMPEPVSVAADWYGEGLNWLLGNAFIATEYWTSDRPESEFKDFLQVYNEAVLFNTVTTIAIKFAIRRDRPGHQNRRSFPSGHTSGSFAIATVLHQFYGPKVGVPAYTMAAVTGMQRIHSNWHWFSDVLAGAVLGSLIGYGFAELIDDNSKAEPVNGPVMVNMSFTF